MTNIDRRTALAILAGYTLMPTLPKAAFAGVYPDRPIRMEVPFPPGGAVDIIARTIMEQILPRHFIQTAELSGVGATVVRSIFEDLAHTFEPAFAKMAGMLPNGFPEALVNSIRVAAFTALAS